tara:strand:+ start:791 stop:2017 length:1227 start_codon:yes stop_codon:yes gene_type:complete
MLKNYLFLLIKLLMRFIDIFLFFKNKKIIFHGYQGIPSGNSLALFNYLKSEDFFAKNLYWTGINNSGKLMQANFRRVPPRNSSIIEHFRYLIFLMSFSVIILESAGDLSFYIRFIPKKKRLKIVLFHGFSLKKGGILDPSLSVKQRETWEEVGKTFDIFSVSSNLQKQLVSKSLGVNENKCVIMGPQRPIGQKTFNKEEIQNARSLLEKTYGIKFQRNEEIIFYTPTHRDHLETPSRPSLFGFKEIDKLNNLLKEKNSFLFLREHAISNPSLREHETSNSKTHNKYSNIIYTNEFEYLDFYLILPALKGLITDYSGIFIEYLLSEVKFGFWHYDLEEYKNIRGLQFNEEIFNTGVKITNPETFIDFLSHSSFSDDIRTQRNHWHNLLFEKSNSEALKLSRDKILSFIK